MLTLYLIKFSKSSEAITTLNFSIHKIFRGGDTRFHLIFFPFHIIIDMDVLRNLFPELPDYILVSYLGAADRNVNRATQNIVKTKINPRKNSFELLNHLRFHNEETPPKQKQPIFIDSSESDNDSDNNNDNNYNHFDAFVNDEFDHIIRPNQNQIGQVGRIQNLLNERPQIVFRHFPMERPQPINRLPFYPRIQNTAIQPPPSTVRQSKVIRGIHFTYPILPQQARTLIENAIKVSSTIDFSRASSFLNMVLQSGKYPDDIVDRLLLASVDSKQVPSASFLKDSLSVLQNLFLDISIAILRRKMNEEKRLLKVIDSLTKLPPQQRMRTPRKMASSITISDPFIAYDLYLLDKKDAEEKAKIEEQEKEEREIEEARKNGSLIECGCCFSEVPIDKCLQCPEGHLFCRDCVMRMIETSVAEGRTNIKCPAMDGCGKDIPMSELERMIPEKTLQRLFQTEAINDIMKSGIDHVVKCFHCGFMVEFIGEGNMKCPQCSKETCSKCGLEAHPHKTCKQAQEEDPEKIIEEKMNDAIIRTCPNCKTPFTKDVGCNKMVCPRCGTWICYWCRQVIPKDVGYEHFWRQAGPCPPDKCPLWVENQQLHLIEATKAKLGAKGELDKIL